MLPQYEVRSLAEEGIGGDIPETADTLEGNALQKALFVSEIMRQRGDACAVFADDTGLEVEALNGAPGIYTARFGAMNGFGDDHDAEANTRCLLAKLEGQANRHAQFRTAIALIINGVERLFEGVVKGVITPSKRGEKGFGYDPVFIPEGYGETFAELGVEQKNRISHRALAVEKLVAYLTQPEN